MEHTQIYTVVPRGHAARVKFENDVIERERAAGGQTGADIMAPLSPSSPSQSISDAVYCRFVFRKGE